MTLINKDQTISKSLIVFLRYFSIDPNQSIQEIVHQTQQLWLQSLRKQNKQHKKPLAPELLALFTSLGMINAINPSQRKYDYILLLGSDEPDMRHRISFLSELIKNGIIASKIIVLCSNRPLYDYEKKCTQAGTECQMIQELLSTIDMKNWPAIEYCQAYGKTNNNGSHLRATTEDTAKSWLATNPKPGICLIISQQPYIGRQHAVMEAHLKNDWRIETIGPQLAADFTLEDMLDTLARWLYQEQKNTSK